MAQDRNSGARANAWGRAKSKDIAFILGATETSRNSNECTIEGKRVVIKCAAIGNNKVGVPYKMLERIVEVIAAFERADGAFELMGISPSVFREAMTPTRSTGNSSGKVGVVHRRVFEAYAERRTTVRA